MKILELLNLTVSIKNGLIETPEVVRNQIRIQFGLSPQVGDDVLMFKILEQQQKLEQKIKSYEFSALEKLEISSRLKYYRELAEAYKTFSQQYGDKQNEEFTPGKRRACMQEYMNSFTAPSVQVPAPIPMSASTQASPPVQVKPAPPIPSSPPLIVDLRADLKITHRFFTAAKNNNLEELKQALFMGADVFYREEKEFEYSPDAMAYACMHSNLEMVEFLHRKGHFDFDVVFFNPTLKKSTTPLREAIRSNNFAISFFYDSSTT